MQNIGLCLPYNRSLVSALTISAKEISKAPLSKEDFCKHCEKEGYDVLSKDKGVQIIFTPKQLQKLQEQEDTRRERNRQVKEEADIVRAMTENRTGPIDKGRGTYWW